MTTAIYSDIRKNMLMDSLTSDVSAAVNDQAIKDSVMNLVMTTRGERLYQPAIGGNISTLLFELMSEDTTYLLQRAIQEVITNWEPRAILDIVEVLPDYDNNKYTITIRFYTKYNLEVSQSVNLNLASKAQAT
ncbi:Lysozyme [compost metagenome]